MRLTRACALAAALVFVSVSARAQEAPASSESSDAKKASARKHFEHGLELYRDQRLDAALAEFIESRSLYPTRAASFNAARVCLALGREDEALDILDSIAKDFPDLSPEDRAERDREIAQATGRVGALVIVPSEPGATVVVDGRERALPQGGAVRVPAGAHVVRVFKDGFVPFEARVDVAAQTSRQVDARLGALTRGGRLAVTEDRGAAVVVVVDGIEVGKAPWEGTISVGKHTVALRGPEKVGSPPTPAVVSLNQLTKLSLVAEPLLCTLRVEPQPSSAEVAVDGVELGQGVWDGPLRCGGHQVEIGAEGFLPRSRMITLVEGAPFRAQETLERDPTSPLWRTTNPPHLILEGAASALIAPSFGGALASECGGSCSSPPALGVTVTARAGYRLGLGIAGSLDAGFFYAATSLTDRATETRPRGLAPQEGTANDALRWSGPMLGASVSYWRADKSRIFARLGGGILVGSFGDTREGDFQTGGATPTGYHLSAAAQSFVSNAIYIDPEVRWAFRLAKTLTLDLGLRALVLARLGSVPHWSDATELSLGNCPGPGPTQNADICSGRGTYADQDLAASVQVFVGPTVTLRSE